MTLKQIRTSLGWTQERMAQELMISLRTYARQERSGGNQTLKKLASLLAGVNQPVYTCAVSKEMVLQNTGS